ncbi:hypothetical protein [Arthrobacter sp. H41]|uniref:hypothetical protein n=1 Tax=Arthrobacter sp. H41 TaxID=1312978 RepID=UPI00047E6264|nr:hypothetical protein [Arthrobacter sp. H41]
MESWRSAERTSELALWRTVFWVAAVVAASLLLSIFMVLRDPGPSVGAGFYVQQAVLLVLSAAFALPALANWRQARRAAR